MANDTVDNQVEERHTVDRLRDIFGSINDVAQAAERRQNTVSEWRKRPESVPISAAYRISKSARQLGLDLQYDQIVLWIAADVQRFVDDIERQAA